MAEHIPFGMEVGSSEEEELRLLPTFIRILSHGPCDIAAFLRMGLPKSRQRRAKVDRRPSPDDLPRHLLVQVLVQENVLAALCSLCSRPSVRQLLHRMGGFAPISTIAFQGVEGRNKVLAQQLIAKMALSEVRAEPRRGPCMYESIRFCACSKRPQSISLPIRLYSWTYPNAGAMRRLLLTMSGDLCAP
jgi:hypothetical protein